MNKEQDRAELERMLISLRDIRACRPEITREQLLRVIPQKERENDADRWAAFQTCIEGWRANDAELRQAWDFFRHGYRERGMYAPLD